MPAFRSATRVAAAALGSAAVLFVLGLQTAALAAPASTCPAGSQYAPAAGCVANQSSVSQRSFSPGQPGQLVAPGFKAGSKATLELHSTPTMLGSFVADSQGVVTATFTIPTSAAAGSHELILAGIDPSGAPFEVHDPIAIAQPVHAAQSTGRGGSHVELITLLALAVVAAAVIGLIAWRRRATPSGSPPAL